MTIDDLRWKLRRLEGEIMGIKKNEGRKDTWSKDVRDRYESLCKRASAVRAQIQERGDDTISGNYSAG
jgi:hypothetical protein